MAYTADDITAMISQYDAGRQATPPAEPDQTPAPAEPAQPAAPTPDPAPAEPQGIEPTVAGQQDKDANAFAQMRTTNKLYEDTIRKIAEATGITATNMDEMITALNGDALTKIAEKKGIPVEFLQRMEALEQNSRNWELQQQQARLTTGFQNLQTKYNVDQNGLMEFAKQLDAEHVNLATVDIEKEYVARNLDAIVNARVQAAVQAALAHDAQVSAQSSIPGAVGSQGGGSDVKIKSAADLVSFLGSMPGGYK